MREQPDITFKLLANTTAVSQEIILTNLWTLENGRVRRERIHQNPLTLHDPYVNHALAGMLDERFIDLISAFLDGNGIRQDCRVTDRVLSEMIGIADHMFVLANNLARAADGLDSESLKMHTVALTHAMLTNTYRIAEYANEYWRMH